jgi:hypothetical protein
MLNRLVDSARLDGAIDHSVTAADIALATIRFCRPLAVGLGPAAEREISHRDLDTYLDGLMSKSVASPRPYDVTYGHGTS